MKKAIILLLLLFYQMPSAFALSYLNQPSGFKGTEWGDSFSKVKSKNIALVLLKGASSSFEDVYVEQKTDNKLYSMDFDRITWHFVDGKLFMVKAVINNDRYIYDPRLSHALQRQHGRPMQTRDNLHQKTATVFWLGDKTYIRLFSDYKNKRTILSLYNDRLYMLWQSKVNKDKGVIVKNA